MQQYMCGISAQGMLCDMSSLGVLLGASHVNTFCLVTAKIPDSQDSRYSP